MSQQELEVFNVLNFLNKGHDIDEILTGGKFGTFPSAQDCINYLIEEDYLEGEAALESEAREELTAEEVSKEYTVAQLKDILRENGLKVSGKKQELIERVLPVLNGGSEKTANSLDDYRPVNLELTEKAHDFLAENAWMDLYMFSLVAFRFEDYETYVKGSSLGMVETALKFCDEILSRALVANQFLVFIDALSAKAHVYAYAGDYDSFMDYDLQRFIIGLNPIVMDAQTYAGYDIINEANIVNLRNVTKKLKMGSLKKRFDRIWNKSHIKNTTVPKKTCFKILLRAIDGADLEELNFDLREKFFNKKFGI